MENKIKKGRLKKDVRHGGEEKGKDDDKISKTELINDENIMKQTENTIERENVTKKK